MHTPFSIISLDDFKKDRESFSEELGLNFRKWGFCGVKDHGVDTKLVKEVQNIFIKFFNLSEDKKLEYYDPKLGGARGYTPFKIETPKDAHRPDLKEFWHIGRELDTKDTFRRWMPDNIDIPSIPDFKKKTNELFLQFDRLGVSLLEAISIHLNLEPNYFNPHVNKGNSVMRVIHYPPVNLKEEGERAGAHEDINLITLLIGGQQAGLEILSNEKGWLRASVDEDVIICNIGDMLQRFTNDNLKSTTHRVRAMGEEMNTSRYSIPFFFHPNPDWFIDTLESQISDQNPNRYPEGILSQDYLQERLKEIKLV